jgi:hypothetical protein
MTKKYTIFLLLLWVFHCTCVPPKEKRESVLSRGLTFCPTGGEPNFGQIWVDLKTFFRRLRITQFFANDPNSKNNTFLDDIYLPEEDNRT